MRTDEGSAAAFFLPLLEEAGNSTSFPTPCKWSNYQITRLPDCNRLGPGASQPSNHIQSLETQSQAQRSGRWLRRSSRLSGFLKLFPGPLRMWGVPRSTPFWELGRQIYLVFPHYKLQSQKEHSKSTSWNLPLSLEALIQHSKGGHPGPPKMGAHSHKSEGSGHGAGL